MTTLPPAGVIPAKDSSLEKQVYTLVETYSELIPLDNDRIRLAYCLCKYLEGEGDSPEILVKSTKIKIEGVSHKELAERINTELTSIKSEC
ncbi:MAG: hypothetical protein KJ799_14170 [Bacteroidetes bacterium]|nr:hypothetical protein [Bacteroidota bacterium]MBU1677257.1 hypothetical protein [Bacteroidota bacterium]MBU2507851.1 hypothetical protein [Bacteroidota bacterium]